ncbi:MAG TPA: ABC transporter permease [Blastocatellia bacterium]|jgi:predicted permease|nr:ABC transporter permease [Blastocatellia bacterium]
MRLKHWIYTAPLRLRSLFRRDRVEQELDEELRYHIDRQIEENIAKGMTPEEARYAALRAMGGVEQRKEECRDMRRVRLIENLTRDVRYGLRTLRKSPGFTAAAALSLALGIGANTAIFSLVNTVLLRPLPVENPERLVSLNWASERGGGVFPSLSYLNYRDLRDRNNVLDGLIAYRMAPISLGHDGISERAWGYLATGNYFDVLGVKPALGRLLTPEDDKAQGANPVTVISYDCWQKRFAGDPHIVGRSVLVNARGFTVIGVAPRGFYGAEISYAAEMWFPIMMFDDIIKWGSDLWDRGGQSYMAQGRLKPGVNMTQAEASINAVMAQLAREYPNENEGKTVLLSPPGLFGAYFRKPVLSFAGILMAAAGFVLLLACLNLANLLLARSMERRKEIAIRLAIGAGRMRIVRQLLTESLLLAFASGAVGLPLAYWLERAVVAFRPQIDFPIPSALPIDHRVLIFTFVASLLTGVIFGLLPALQSTRPDLAPGLKDEISYGGSRRSFSRGGLVVSQVALSLLLLICAGLVARGLQRAKTLNPGFNPQNSILMSFDLGLQGYDGARSKIFKQQLLERVRALPGVQSAGLADYLPFELMTRNSNIFAEGQPLERRSDPPSALRGSAGPGFLQGLGARLLQGRDFTAADNETKRSMAVVNETFARGIWKGAPAVGKRFSFFGPEGPWIEVIGVIQDGKYSSLGEEARMFVYTNLEDDKGGNGLTLNMVVRTESEPRNMIAAIRREFGRLDPTLPIFNVKTMVEHMNFPLFPARVAAALLGGFGLLALLISAIGLFGVMSYAVSQRTHEIGIRLALGAQPRNILRLITGHGLKLTLIGLTSGLVGALALTRVMSPLLYGVSAVDPLTFSLISILLLCVALLACWLPARRAMRVDPVIALRSE